MNNTLVLHTGSDRLEQEYAKYVKERVGAKACTGLNEIGDISSFDEIICVFRYEYKNAALPEAVEDLFFERAEKLAGKKVEFAGFGERSDGFRKAVADLSSMCGVSAVFRFLKESTHVYVEHTDKEGERVLFVREIKPETVEPEPAEEIPEAPAVIEPAAVPAEEKTVTAAKEPAAAPAGVPTEAPAEKEPAEEPAAAEKAPESSKEPEEVPEAEAENEEPPMKSTPETYMDEAALAAAVRAVIAESEETISQVTDEVSAEFPDEEEAENEEPGEESEDRVGDGPAAESRAQSEEINREDDGQSREETPVETGGEVSDGGDDTYDDWDPAKSGRNDSEGGQVSLEEHPKEREEEPAGEVLPEETAQKEPAHDPVGVFSWNLSSGEALKKNIRRANGEEPWPEEEIEPPKPKKEPAEGKSYRFIDESVTAPEEAVYEPPLGLSDLEAMEAEEAAEAVNRRERRKERAEREEEPEEGIIARAAAKILAFFRGNREEEEDLDFGDDEKEAGSGKSGDKSFFDKIRDDVGVYDEDDGEFRDDAEEPQSDYDEDDVEEFDDDADFSDSFEEDEDEDDF